MRPGITSKCLRLSVMSGTPAAMQQAAIQASFAATGLPTASQSAVSLPQTRETVWS